jgi:DNA-directed RNA polymerase specialized sigma24 family protein
VATPEALERLYRSRFRAFLKVAAGVAGERHAPDAVHDGFVRALRYRGRFRQGASLEAWVWRTTDGLRSTTPGRTRS